MQPRFHALLAAAAVTLVAGGCKGRTERATTTQETGAAPAAEVAIADVQLGRHLGADKRVSDATDKFSPRDTIYAAVETSGSAPSTTVTARWTYEGQQIVKEDSRTIAPSGQETTEFHISKPSGWPKGKYQVTFTVGGATQTKDFEVK
ncbi:MAG TPA: hypothetical protein VIM84_07510 [Gemmatimonadales bacterium]